MAEELAVLLGKQFLERRDVKAVQGKDGAWRPERTKEGENIPWKLSDLRDHIDGTRTLGHYLVSPEGKCKLFAFDIDLRKQGFTLDLTEQEDGVATDKVLDPIECNPREVWLDVNHPGRTFLTIQLRTIADALASRIHTMIGCHVAIATSGCKGLHVYGLMGTVPAAQARSAAQMVLDSFHEPNGSPSFVPSKGVNFFTRPGRTNIEIEVFPKQDNLDNKDLGNLMALPLGVNLKTGARKKFITSNAGYDRLVAMDAERVLTGELPWD